MNTKDLKIGFLSVNNYYDRLSFSGILWCMHRALAKRAQVVPLGRPYHPSRLRDLWRRWESHRLDGASFNGHPSALLLKLGDTVKRQLKRQNVDIVFAPVASRELTVLEFDQPLLYASDATFQLLNDFYNLGLTPQKAEALNNADLLAIQRAAGIAYPSNWAADSAIEHYGATRDKIRVIPFGANLVYIPSHNRIMEKCNKRPWRLVFLGLDWNRKGGDIALETFRGLLRSGIDAELTVIGTTPPQGSDLSRVRVIPFVDKRRKSDQILFWNIMLNSHIMIFPSRADCSPIALCEAAAYGIPVVASDVGGVSTIVTEGNGRLLPARSPAESYIAAVRDLISSPQRYSDMVLSARQRYDDVLNWDKWAHSLLTFCEHLL